MTASAGLPGTAGLDGRSRAREGWKHPVLPYVVLALAFAAGFALRPVLPIDETRYLTVAWEMWLRGDHLVPTVNFAPYFRKPPLLFWLINLSWGVFGVGRASALVVIFLVSALAIHLTQRLARTLLPGRDDVASRIPWLLVGNLVFLAYSSFILFDLLLTACMLGALLSFLAFARHGRRRYSVLSGLFAGLGVLAKGPVVFIHLAWPLLLYPLLRKGLPDLAARANLRVLPLLLLCACLPIAAWVVPAVIATGPGFAYNLIWLESAGRVAGNIEAAHPRSILFYLPLLPLFLLPWLFVPDFWRGARVRWKERAIRRAEDAVIGFLLLWSAGVVLTFSLISGKQPHYLVPILAPLTVVIGCLLPKLAPSRLGQAAALSLGVLVAVQVGAWFFVFPSNDLSGVAERIMRSPGEWAVFGRTQGELGFLARRSVPFTVVDQADAASWLAAGPSRHLIDLSGKAEGLGQPAYSQPYRKGELWIFEHASP